MSDHPAARLVCRCCGLPVLRGQPHWAGDREGYPWHYECAERTGLTIPWHPLRPDAALAAATIEEPLPAGR